MLVQTINESQLGEYLFLQVLVYLQSQANLTLCTLRRKKISSSEVHLPVGQLTRTVTQQIYTIHKIPLIQQSML